jgi:hypothetical protein
VPVIVLAGQSNAVLPAVDYALIQGMQARGGAFEFVARAENATSVFAGEGVEDWDPASTGELADQLVAAINTATANVRLQGAEPEISVLWIQGENDRGSDPDAYLAQLTALFAYIRDGVGQGDAQISIVLIPEESGARIAQLAAAEAIPGVSTIESRGLEKFDGVHFSDDAAATIADAFLQQIDPRPPVLEGYASLLEPGSISLVNGAILIDAGQQEPLNWFALTATPLEIHGWQGPDRITTGAGNDRILAGGNADVVNAGGGNDFVDGEVGEDIILGGDGNDILLGRQGSDFIDGGPGDDVIVLGTEQDVGIGGEGHDIFRFTVAAHSLPDAPDRIRDFEPGVDHLELLRLGDLSFIGTAQFSGSGQVRYENEASLTVVQIDLDGDSAADMVIELDGVLALSAGDFSFG